MSKLFAGSKLWVQLLLCQKKMAKLVKNQQHHQSLKIIIRLLQWLSVPVVKYHSVFSNERLVGFLFISMSLDVIVVNVCILVSLFNII